MSSNPCHSAAGRPAWPEIRKKIARRAGLLAGNLLDVVFPPTCAFCLSDIREFTDLREKTEAMLCAGCRERLFPVYEPACGRCGYPAPPGGRSTPEEGCPHCATKQFRFETAFAMGVYQGSLQMALLRMKHFRGRTLAAAVGRWMAIRLRDQLSAFRPDFVVPIPARWRRRMARGANGPAVLARRIARQLRIPVFPDLLRWQRNIKRQHTLLPTERYRNVHGALAVSRGYDIREARVLLVDDILTTGATANEATRVLDKAGASGVCVAIVARVADR